MRGVWKLGGCLLVLWGGLFWFVVKLNDQNNAKIKSGEMFEYVPGKSQEHCFKMMDGTLSCY